MTTAPEKHPEDLSGAQTLEFPAEGSPLLTGNLDDGNDLRDLVGFQQLSDEVGSEGQLAVKDGGESDRSSFGALLDAADSLGLFSEESLDFNWNCLDEGGGSPNVRDLWSPEEHLGCVGDTPPGGSTPIYHGSFGDCSSPLTSSPCISKKRSREEDSEEEPGSNMTCERTLPEELSFEEPTPSETSFPGPTDPEEEPQPSTSWGSTWGSTVSWWYRPKYDSDSDSD